MVVREDSAVAESQRQPTLARPDTLRPTRKRLFNNERQVGDRETRWPRFSTVYKLCKAVGIDLVMAQPKQTKKPAALKVG